MYGDGVTAVGELGSSKYVLLTTYRRDGRAVPTPVWVVRLDDDLAVWTPVDSGKVKRIRRDPRVTVATCDLRGRDVGPAHPARAELLDREGTDRVRKLIVRRYGLVARLTQLGSRIRRGRAGTVGIRLRVGGE